MNLISRLAGAMGYEKRSSLASNTFRHFTDMRATAVTAASAQGVSAVFACVSAIAETTASLPLILFRRKEGDDREVARDHPLYKVLHDMANPQMTALEAREFLQASVLLRGNAYARIVRGYDGQVRELWPLSPDKVSVLRVGDAIAYDVMTINGKMQRLLDYEVLHLRHRLSEDGVMGISPITAARSVVELAQAEAEHGVNTFRNGARMLGVLKFPGTLSTAQRENVRNSWASQHAGGANAGRTAILEEGVSFDALSMTMEDSEWLAARQFSVEEVCRLFRVPPTIVGDLRHGNYSNSVELARQFVTMSLRRHLVMWEQAVAQRLLTEAGRRTYFAEHAVEGLLRGDSGNRSAFYTAGIEAGWLLRSEARRLENLPTIEGIDHVQPTQAQAVDAQTPPAGTAPARADAQGTEDPHPQAKG